MASKENKNSRPCWESFAGRFTDPGDCLAAFVALEAAEVLQGVKPANLLNITNRRRSCGQNLYHLWRQYGSAAIREAGLAAREMVDRHDSILLLIYNPQALGDVLARKNVVPILAKAGYRYPANLEEALADLQSRLQGGSFPHEIGVFLGYPLKDVIGFMGWAKLPYTCQGPWKIYGDPTGSLQLADACRRCRLNMADRLATCNDPRSCLRQQPARQDY